MKRLFKRLLFLVLALVVLLTVAIAVISSSFSDQIGARLVREINARLTTELRVEGFELSFLKTFPNVGANLRGVSLQGADGEELLQAEELSFRAGLLSLLTSDIKMRSVVLSEGSIRVTVDENGRANYDIMKPGEPGDAAPEAADPDADDGASIDLEEAVIKNVSILYRDAQTKQGMAADVFDAVFAGNFGAGQYDLTSEAGIFIRHLDMDDEPVLTNQMLEYEAELSVDAEAGQYQIAALDILLGELPLQAAGNFRIQEDDTFINVQFSSEDGQLQDVISLLPAAYRRQLRGVETSGDFVLNASVEGVQNERQQPKIIAELRFEDGRISGDRINARVRDLGFLAYYTNGPQQNERTSKLVIENLHGEFEREPFALDLTIENFEEPSVVFSANGTLAPGALPPFLGDERVTAGTGKIYVDHVSVRGKYRDMLSNSQDERVNMSGALRFDDAGLTVNDEAVRLPAGELRVEGNTLFARQVVFEAPGTRMQFDGRATNILPVLLADSVNSERAVLLFDAELRAESLDIDELLALSAPAEEVVEDVTARGMTDSLAQAEVAKRELFANFLDGRFAATVDAFNFNEIEGENFRGELVFKDGVMRINGDTEAMGGRFLLDGEAAFTDRPVLTAKLSGDDVDVHEFFRQSENFGQDVLVADNLAGRVDTRMFIEAHFDRAGNFLTDELRVLAGVGLRDGVLKDFAMLEDFSTFVNIRDLRDIRIKNMQNFFEVRNSRLYLPVMFIQSNAMNLTISGEHTFEQDIKYYVKVNAGQIMADRFRRHNPRLKPKPAKRNGFFNLYYAILGNLDNYNFVSDKRRVKNDFNESEARKRDIHHELERRFGTVIELTEEPQDWRDIPEYQEDPDSGEPEFLDMEIEGGGG